MSKVKLGSFEAISEAVIREALADAGIPVTDTLVKRDVGFLLVSRTDQVDLEVDADRLVEAQAVIKRIEDDAEQAATREAAESIGTPGAQSPPRGPFEWLGGLLDKLRSK